jgi:hypothetical protein
VSARSFAFTDSEGDKSASRAGHAAAQRKPAPGAKRQTCEVEYSRQTLLKPPATTSSDELNDSAPGPPPDLAVDERVTGERAQARPQRRLQRKAELIARAPALNLDQVVALGPEQDDPPRLATRARATREGHFGDRRSSPVKLLPDVLAVEELRTRWFKSSRMKPRAFATARR